MNLIATALSLPAAASSTARRVATVAAEVAAAAERVPGLVVRLDAVLTVVEALVLRADQLIVEVDDARAGAVLVTDRVDVLQLRATLMVEPLEPLVASLSKLDVDLPAEAGELVRAALPLLKDLQRAIPDVRAILTTVQALEPVMTDVETRIAGLPGAGRLLRRGEKEIEAAQTAAAD